MDEKQQAMTQLIREVRTCFNQMKSLVEILSADFGVNPSMRSIMESLAGNRSRTVPDLAKERGVSRQHVQTVMNMLLDRKLAEAADNPGHKRSPLYGLTEPGETIFRLIRDRETRPLAVLTNALEHSEITAAAFALRKMNLDLADILEKENQHDDS